MGRRDADDVAGSAELRRHVQAGEPRPMAQEHAPAEILAPTRTANRMPSSRRRLPGVWGPAAALGWRGSPLRSTSRGVDARPTRLSSYGFDTWGPTRKYFPAWKISGELAGGERGRA